MTNLTKEIRSGRRMVNGEFVASTKNASIEAFQEVRVEWRRSTVDQPEGIICSATPASNFHLEIFLFCSPVPPDPDN